VSFIEEHGGELILLVIGIAAALVIVFVVAYPSFLKNYNVWANLWGNLGGPPKQSTDFENAMKCAYYRCAKGCDSNEVKSLTATWSDPQTGNQVSCTDFCSAGQTICNEDSINNPVRIDIGEKAYLDQSQLSSDLGIYCIEPPEYQGRLPVPLAVVITSSDSIDQSSITNSHSVCSLGTILAGTNALSSLNLNPGKYIVYVSSVVSGVAKNTYDNIYISPYQKSTSTGTSGSSTPCLPGQQCNCPNGPSDCNTDFPNCQSGKCCKPSGSSTRSCYLAICVSHPEWCCSGQIDLNGLCTAGSQTCCSIATHVQCSACSAICTAEACGSS
jgi:hypothetical protein